MPRGLERRRRESQTSPGLRQLASSCLRLCGHVLRPGHTCKDLPTSRVCACSSCPPGRSGCAWARRRSRSGMPLRGGGNPRRGGSNSGGRAEALPGRGPLPAMMLQSQRCSTSAVTRACMLAKNTDAQEPCTWPGQHWAGGSMGQQEVLSKTRMQWAQQKTQDLPASERAQPRRRKARRTECTEDGQVPC